MSAEFRKKFKETFFFAKNKQPVRNTIKRRNTAEVDVIPAVNSVLNSNNKKHNYFGYLFKQFKNKNNIRLNNTNNYNNNNNELLLVNVDDKNNINNIVRENDFC
jgi:hypothetical protein